MKKILVILGALTLLMVSTGLVEAWCCSVIWNWFAADSVGPVSLQAWFGITTLVGLVLAIAFTNMAKDSSEEKSYVIRVLNTAVNIMLTCLFTLGVTGLIGLALGWI